MAKEVGKLSLGQISAGVAGRTVYIKLITRGVPSIHEGREFVLRAWSDEEPKIIGHLVPYQPEITLGGEVVASPPVTLETPLLCTKCSAPLKRSLVSHNLSWMITLFACDCSPRDIWLDMFPKLDPFCFDTRSSWYNAFYGFDTLDKLPEGAVIEGLSSPRTEFLRFMKQVHATYLLTPNGIQPL